MATKGHKEHKETEPLKIQEIRIEDIMPDPNQPRKEFAEDKLEEMAASIREQGILQPLIVRQSPDKKIWLLVSGERRWRAAQLAKLETVPAVVRELNDGQVFAVQMIENLQRENLTALEEAAALQRRVTAGARADDLARETGLSRATVFGRLALTRLETPVRTALIKGMISTSVAQLIGMVPDKKKQETLLEDVAATEYQGPRPFREVQEEIEADYCKQLKDAPFDTKDEDLVPTEWAVSTHGEGDGLRITGPQPIIPASRKAHVGGAQVDDGLGNKRTVACVVEGLAYGAMESSNPLLLENATPRVAKAFAALVNSGAPFTVLRIKGGACTDCPYRSGNLPEFPEAAKRPNICTLPSCYHEKCKAHWTVKAAASIKAGQTVLDATQYKRAKGEYVEADKYEYTQGKSGTYKELMGKHAPAPVLAVTPKGLIKVYPKKEAKAALEKAGVKLYHENRTETAEGREKEKQREAAAKAAKEKRNALVLECAPTLALALEKLSDKDSWRLLAEWSKGLDQAWQSDLTRKLRKLAKGPRTERLCYVLGEQSPVSYNGQWDGKRVAWWKELGVDLVGLEKDRERDQGTKGPKDPKTKGNPPSSKALRRTRK